VVRYKLDFITLHKRNSVFTGLNIHNGSRAGFALDLGRLVVLRLSAGAINLNKTRIYRVTMEYDIRDFLTSCRIATASDTLTEIITAWL
jgi:hypothetical protein